MIRVGKGDARFSVAGWVVQTSCPQCGTGTFDGQLESDGWFRCPLNHQWRIPCGRCSSPIVIRREGLVCAKRGHLQPY